MLARQGWDGLRLRGKAINLPPTPGTPIPETDTALPCGVRSEKREYVQIETEANKKGLQ